VQKATIDTAKEKALKRYAFIAPLIEEGISAFEFARRKKVLLENRNEDQSNICERTLRRWLSGKRSNLLRAG